MDNRSELTKGQRNAMREAIASSAPVSSPRSKRATVTIDMLQAFIANPKLLVLFTDCLKDDVTCTSDFAFKFAKGMFKQFELQI